MHVSREGGGAADGRLQQGLAAAAQVVEALLVVGPEEPVIGRPAVMDHHAIIVCSDNRFGDLVPAPDVDVIQRHPGRDESVHPGELAADAPAGLVGYDPRGYGHGGEDSLIGSHRRAARCIA